MPILEEKPVWGTSDDTRTAYLDTVDISRMILASLRSEASHRASLTLAGPKAWTTGEVRTSCMHLSTCYPHAPPRVPQDPNSISRGAYVSVSAHLVF